MYPDGITRLLSWKLGRASGTRSNLPAGLISMAEVRGASMPHGFRVYSAKLIEGGSAAPRFQSFGGSTVITRTGARRKAKVRQV
jgi:hypothetical protein